MDLFKEDPPEIARAKEELYGIWTNAASVTCSLIVVIPIIIYFLNKYGFFDNWASLQELKEVAGIFLLWAGLAYAPVWICCSIYLVFLIFKFVFTVPQVLARAAKYRTGASKDVSKEDLIRRLSED